MKMKNWYVEENQDDSDTDDFMDAFDDSILDEE